MIRRKGQMRRAANLAVVQGARITEPPLCAGVAALSRAQHQGYVWRAPRDLDFAARLGALPITMPEVLRLAAALPLAIAAGDVPRPMAVLSVQDGGASPLITQGRIAGDLAPAILDFYPFVPMADAAAGHLGGDFGGNCLTVGNAGAGWLPLFGADGALGADVAARIAGLPNWQIARQSVLAAARALDDAGLLCPAPLLGDRGWRSVDAAALLALRGARLDHLNACGGLALAYGLLVGAAHLPRLVRRAAPAARPVDAAGDFIAAFAQAQANTPRPDA